MAFVFGHPRPGSTGVGISEAQVRVDQPLLPTAPITWPAVIASPSLTVTCSCTGAGRPNGRRYRRARCADLYVSTRVGVLGEFLDHAAADSGDGRGVHGAAMSMPVGQEPLETGEIRT